MSHANFKKEGLKAYAEQLGCPEYPEQFSKDYPKVERYDLAVIIGRFEPYHVGHQILVNKALMVADNVLVLIGSSHAPRTIKNPFTFEERAAMISESTEGKVICMPLVDNLYSDDDWVNSVQNHITDALTNNGCQNKSERPRVAIVGNKKDDSSYYLDLFPQYDYVAVDEVKLGFDATNVRQILFEQPGMLDLLKSLVPSNVHNFMTKFVKTSQYLRLHREYFMVKKYKEAWKAAPYAPTFVTVDAVVKKSGHILLVRRKAAPGEGLWALPGGFLEQGERIRDAAVRELIEETSIDLPRGLLQGSMGEGSVFDHPGRSLRGRTISHAYLFDLDRADKKVGLPKVKGADDAAEARWFTFAEILAMPHKLFEDHLSIIRNVARI